MNAIPSRAAFGNSLGTSFRFGAVAGLGGPVEVVLTTVDDRRTPPGMECFSLLFEGPAASALPQGSFPVSHGTLGDFALFIVPIGATGGVRSYEAIVFRPLPIEAEGD